MKKILEDMLAAVNYIDNFNILTPPNIEPPTSFGVKKSEKEIPIELKKDYTLVEHFAARVRMEKAKSEKERTHPYLEIQEMCLKFAADYFRMRFVQRYGEDEKISLYSDWHVYTVPAYYK
jgi:hypothetical protein